MAVNRSGDERRTEEEARIAQLYRLASTEIPPAHIDTAIAAAARAPGKAAPQSRALAWWNMWRVPFAFAAVAVVSVSLVTLMMEEDSDRVASAPQRAPPVVPERDFARSQPEAADGGAPKADERKPERRQGSDGPSQQNAATMPPAAPQLDTTESRRMSREDAAAQQAPPSAAEATAGTVQKAAPTEAVQSRVEAPAPIAQDRAPAAAMARARPEAQAGASEEPAPSSPPARAAPKAALGMRALESERPAAPASRPSPEVAAHILQLEGREPSMWIERIVALRRDGRRAEADGLLAEFKRRYPEETLPASLQ